MDRAGLHNKEKIFNIEMSTYCMKNPSKSTGENSIFVQVTALGAAVAAGSSLGIWTVGAKMDGITVYRYVFVTYRRKRGFL